MGLCCLCTERSARSAITCTLARALQQSCHEFERINQEMFTQRIASPHSCLKSTVARKVVTAQLRSALGYFEIAGMQRSAAVIAHDNCSGTLHAANLDVNRE